MNTAKTYILSLLLLPAILLFTAGFKLFQHSCDSCEITKWSVSSDKVCCVGTSKCSLSTADVGCCGIPEVEGISTCTDKCCDTKFFLLSIDDSFMPGKVIPESLHSIKNLSPLSQLANFGFQDLKDVILPRFYAPPPRFSGIALLIFTRQLKIDCFTAFFGETFTV